RSLQVVQAVARRPECGPAVRGNLADGSAPEEVGDVELVVDRGGGNPQDLRRGGYFGVSSRRPVDGLDFAREMSVFLPSTGSPVDGSYFAKSVVITRRSTGRRQNIRF